MPNVGDVYETTLHDAVVLWCVDVSHTIVGTRYTFFVLDDGDVPRCGSRFRIWLQDGMFGNTFDMERAIAAFHFKKLV